MKKIALIILSAWSLQVLAQNPANTDTRFAGLDTAFQRVLKNWHAAGFAVAVIDKDKIVYAKGFGYRNVQNHLPATANTLFAIGSCTKAFTASLIGKLQQDGKLDIDKPVKNYLPSLKFYNNELTDNITLRDMMSHRTGLPRHDYSWYFFNTTSMDSLIQRIQYMEPTYALRQRWQYNNFMFMAQGAVAEKLSGKSWDDNIKEKFFIPLGMSRSVTNIPDMEKMDDIATGYGLKKDSIIKKLDYYHINGMAPAGSINSSVNDMAKWVITWINKGKYQGKEIIPAQYRDDAISSQSIIAGALPDKDQPDVYFANYGFGWFLSSYRGHYRVEHGGNIDGFSASTCFFPADSVGIVVLSNQDGSVVPAIVRNLIADRLLKLKYKDWNRSLRKQADKGKQEAEKVQKEKKAVKSNPATHSLADFAGNYSNAGYGSMKIYVKNDSLFTQTVTHKLWLRHLNYDIFDPYDVDPHDGIDTTDKPEVKFQFHMSLSGDIDGVESQMEAGVKPIFFTRQLAAVAVTADALKKYTGDYVLAGITAKVYVKDKTLFVTVPNQPDYELVALGSDKFALKALNGYYLQFGPRGSDKITEATFIQPNGSFKAVRK